MSCVFSLTSSTSTKQKGRWNDVQCFWLANEHRSHINYAHMKFIYWMLSTTSTVDRTRHVNRFFFSIQHHSSPISNLHTEFEIVSFNEIKVSFRMYVSDVFNGSNLQFSFSFHHPTVGPFWRQFVPVSMPKMRPHAIGWSEREREKTHLFRRFHVCGRGLVRVK